MKALKLFLGLLLLPLCWAASATFGRMMLQLHTSVGSDIPPSAWAWACGFLLWMLIFFAMPRPVRTYVLAHELTHALWGALMGARVKRMSVAAAGGSVTLTKTNFLIALAPYFFPFYTVLVVVAYLLLSLFTNAERWQTLWMATVGFTWAFHLSFTISTLCRNQTDIEEHGRIFSYTVIYIANLAGISLWTVLTSPATMLDLIPTFAGQTVSAYGRIADWTCTAWTWIRASQ